VDPVGGHGDLRLTLVRVTYRDTLYRALHPRSDVEPLTGRWSALLGGRFNRKGREALYTSLSPLTAMREVIRSGRLQPTLVVAFEADLTDIVDAAASGLDEALLSTPAWREGQVRGEVSPSQRLAEDLIAQGAHGLLVRSFAPDAGPLEMNLVLWTWDATSLRLIDDERRLPPP
jgi:RES domain-containing protein